MCAWSPPSANGAVIGTLVGALVGARHGLEAIPKEWRTDLERSDELHTLANDAATAFAKSGAP